MPEWMFVLIELLSLAAIVAGCALIYVPAGFLAAGIAGLWVSSAVSRKRSAAK